MNLLLDTHSLLWAIKQSRSLSPAAARAICATDAVVYASAVSIWEISLKFSLGKLDLGHDKPEDLLQALQSSGFFILDLLPPDVATFHRLPHRGHKDPFDRLLVWQSIRHDLTLVSCDVALEVYEPDGLRLLW